jgi:hypothetical protein
MMAIDSNGNCWVAQDKNPKIAVIDPQTSVAVQLDIPIPTNNSLSNASGPGIVTAPDGSIWCSLLGADGCLLRINPLTRRIALYELPRCIWASALRLIHFAFDIVECEDAHGENFDIHYMYALSSSLLDHQAMNAVIVLRFDTTWSHIQSQFCIPLPTQECACHRIQVIGRGLPAEQRAVVVTELASSKLLEIKTHNLRKLTPVVEHVEHVSESSHFERHRYMDPMKEHNVALLARAGDLGGARKALALIDESVEFEANQSEKQCDQQILVPDGQDGGAIIDSERKSCQTDLYQPGTRISL